VRDDYGGYLSCDTTLAGVQQYPVHLYRYLDDACATDPVSQAWDRQAGDALRAAAAAVKAARADGQASLDPELLDRLRHGYDQAITFGSRSICPGPGTRATTTPASSWPA
jgi:hypothetical protein